MKVRISDLSPEGLHIQERLTLELLNARMNEGRSAGIQFTEAPTVDLVIQRTHEGAEARGTINARYAQACGRCLEPKDRTTSIETRFQMVQGSPPSDGDFSDQGIIYFSGDQVEIEDLLQETLILSMSLYWTPPVGREGQCTLCGLAPTSAKEEPPAKIKLGDLLAKAKEKAGK